MNNYLGKKSFNGDGNAENATNANVDRTQHSLPWCVYSTYCHFQRRTICVTF